ncbi:hypothetical protein C8R45DRAFT_1028098 [Mycena sanguinolenta]|nr:hypothetical protein C8R45DRAFT_1028098 [Mycena sanguinolenta]
MTKLSAAQKREKRRAERELQRVEEEKLQRATVSTLTRPPFDPSTPTPVDLADTPVPHTIHAVRTIPAPSQPTEDALRPHYLPSFRFPEHWLHENVPPLPSQWPEHVRTFVYGPNPSWADDLPEPVALAAVSVVHASRNWANLRSVGAHPWRAIRRRKRRLRADHSGWEPLASHFEAPPAVMLTPLRPVPLLEPLEGWSQDLPLRPADLLGLIPFHSDEPFHPDDVPLDNLPPPSLCLFPHDHPPSRFPVETEYGEVTHQLAFACSRALPTSYTAPLLRDIAWPPLEYTDGGIYINPDARPELLGRLPADHIVFLCAIVVMGRLEPPFALFFDGVVADFIHRWVYHCELGGEPG